MCIRDSTLSMYPGSLSVGMAQRIVLAIALASNPRLLVLDEPTTGLDMTNVYKVIDLLGELRVERNLTLLLISHDIGVVGTIADRIAIMYAGYVVETGGRADVLKRGGIHHPYTDALLASVPEVPSEGRLGLRGFPGAAEGTLSFVQGPSPDNRGGCPGCPFVERCQRASEPMRERCRILCPGFAEVEPGHHVRCFLYGGPG